METEYETTSGYTMQVDTFLMTDDNVFTNRTTVCTHVVTREDMPNGLSLKTLNFFFLTQSDYIFLEAQTKCR